MIREESIRIPFRFAAGRAGSRMLAALRDDKQILGSHCPACVRTLAPARPFCPDCGGENLKTVNLGPGAVLVSWTEVPGRGLFALVRPDAADTAMIHRLLGRSDDFHIGVRLRAVFAAERRGHIADLQGFERDPRSAV